MSKESLIRKLTHILNLHNGAMAIGVAMASFHLYTGVFGSLPSMKQRAIHLLFVFLLVFLVYPAIKGRSREKLPFYDWVLILLSLATTGYILVNFEYIRYERIYYFTPLLTMEKVLGIIIIVLILEAARRTVGLFLTVVATVFSSPSGDSSTNCSGRSRLRYPEIRAVPLTGTRFLANTTKLSGSEETSTSRTCPEPFRSPNGTV